MCSHTGARSRVARWIVAIVALVALQTSKPAHALETADGTYFTFDVLLSGGVVLDWENLVKLI